MAQCQAPDCYQESCGTFKTCISGRCYTKQSYVVCEDHIGSTFYVCSAHTNIGRHPMYDDIIHSEHIEYNYCGCGSCGTNPIMIILTESLVLFTNFDGSYYLMRYKTNIFPYKDNSSCTKIENLQQVKQTLYLYTYRPHLLLWKIRPELYFSALPSDICNIISLYL